MKMNTFTDFSRHVVTVQFTTYKNCFLMVPKEMNSLFSSDLPVLKISYGKYFRTKAYMSCKIVSHGGDVRSAVFMNAKYAEKLGIKENENVHLELVNNNIPEAKEVLFEPLTSDDWEILELNAELVEINLMHQIRIIWTNQVFPVWLKNSVIYFKVLKCEPEGDLAILAENTKVAVTAKDRNPSNLDHQSNSAKQLKKANYLQFQHLRYEELVNSDYNDGEVHDHFSPVSMVSNNNFYFSSIIPKNWWPNSLTEEKQHSKLKFLEEFEEFYVYNFKSVLRVLPYSNCKFDLSIRNSTIVFISADTYVSCCGDHEVPPCFVAVLQKFSVSKRKLQKAVPDNTSKSHKDNYSSDNSLTKNASKLRKDNDSVKGQEPFDSVCVTVMVIKTAEEDEFGLPLSLFTYKNAIVVPKELKRAYNLEVGSLVHLKSVNTRPVPLTKLIVHPVSSLNEEITIKDIHENFIKSAFVNKRMNSFYVISDGTYLKLKINGKECEFFIQVKKKEQYSEPEHNSDSFSSLDSDKSKNFKNEIEYGLLNYKCAKEISVEIGSDMCSTIYNDRPYLFKDAGLYCSIHSFALEKLGGIKELSSKAIQDIEYWLKLRPLGYISNHTSTYSGGLLICGPKGVGKSALANALCQKFVGHPHHVFIQTLQCLPLKGKRIETVAKKWDDIVTEAVCSQPSIILLEDLDCIASCPASQEQESGPDGIYFAGISQAFVHLMNKIVACEGKVIVIVTSQSLHSLHPSLVSVKGRHIFQSILEVNPPNAEQRADILVSITCNKPHIDQETIYVNFSEIAAKTEGYVAEDLCTLVNRAVHAAWVRLASSAKCDCVPLEQQDFEIALKGFTPSSLRGLSLQMQDQKTWKDVGGLKSVKKIIQQIILWPAKYKKLYKNYSLKAQTNILLYGAPGTGKTLLAGVVANECGLNFISIKGPELLSKYIGASEQAVRDLFKRAATARPCILFFDEFDSIAPRRGHDSTGVTDRVVNQLLTQLDGVESLEGVHVLAATSRPELIDPALLRPGRLDKCILCPLPNKEERADILHCLSSKLPMSGDIDFISIAVLTENFSGADLQALLYSSHIEALHDTQLSSTRCYSTSSEDEAYSSASDKVLYMPSIEEGLKKPSYEEGKKIVQDVTVVQDKYFGLMERSSRRHSTLCVSITQTHLLKVAAEMKPSVSLEERIRYEHVFENFENFAPQRASVDNVKRVTLA